MAKVMRSDTATGYRISVSTATSTSATASQETAEFDRFVSAAQGLLAVTKVELDEKLDNS